MHPHLTEDDLILHFYGDGPVPDEAAVDEHLRSCSECQAQWAELQQTLKLVDAAAVPEPAEDFEAAMWARVQRALPDNQPRVRPFRQSWTRWLAPAAGLAAAVTIAIGVGRLWPTTSHGPAPAAPAAA